MGTRAVDLFKDKGTKISQLYKMGSNCEQLAKRYKCARNTMMVTLGILGYKVEPWAEKAVAKKIEYLKEQKDKRVKK